MKTRMMVAMVLGLSGIVSAAVITNADFENGMTGWTTFGNVTASQVAGGGPDGSGCVQLENASGADNGIRSDMFEIEPEVSGTGYDLSVDILRNGLGTWAAVSVVMEYYDASGTLLDWSIPFSGLNGTVGWQTFTHHYDSLPPGTAQGRLLLRLEYGGWYGQFDKVSFGATLNQVSLQALLDNGGTVTLPKGTHTINSSLFFRHAGTTLTGSKDSVIRFAPGAGIWGLSVEAADCTIRGITIQGNWDTDPQDNGASGIRVIPAGHGGRIEGVTLKKQTGAAIRLDGVSNVRIEGCTIEDFAGNGILLQPASGQHCSDVVVSGCQIQGTRTPAYDGIFVMGVPGNPGAHNITITSNICRVNCDFGIEVGDVFDGYHTSIVVANNIVDNATNAGIGLRSVNDGVVTGNRVSNCGSAGYGGDGIFATGDSKLCQGLTICGNSISVRPSTGSGIHVTNYERVLVADNSIDTAVFGIWLEGESGRAFHYCTLRGNILTNTGMGIRAMSQNGARNIQIQGNTIRSCTGCGIQVAASGTRPKFVIVTNNQIEDCTADHPIELYYVENGRVNYNYMMNCPMGVSISSCSNVTQTGNVIFTP